MKKLVLAAAMVAGMWWLFAGYDDPTSIAHDLAPLVALGLGALGFLRLVFRRRKSRQPSPQAWIVAQAIWRPLPAPSVAEAFARLPDYCRSPTRKDQA